MTIRPIATAPTADAAIAIGAIADGPKSRAPVAAAPVKDAPVTDASVTFDLLDRRRWVLLRIIERSSTRGLPDTEIIQDAGTRG
jgi:hypothetical protein